MNRETWLEGAVQAFRPWFEKVQCPLPENIQVSCGWPRGLGKVKNNGQTFEPEVSGGAFQIYISPLISEDITVLATLLSELCHTAVGLSHGNSGPFAKLIRQFGLSGKATATFCKPGTSLWADLRQLSANLGEYPHSAINARRVAPTRPPGGGWVKFRSKILGDGYILRVSPKSLGEHGPPRGPSGEEMEQC